jgi:hypothetical protein
MDSTRIGLGNSKGGGGPWRDGSTAVHVNNSPNSAARGAWAFTCSIQWEAGWATGGPRRAARVSPKTCFSGARSQHPGSHSPAACSSPGRTGTHCTVDRQCTATPGASEGHKRLNQKWVAGTNTWQEMEVRKEGETRPGQGLHRAHAPRTGTERSAHTRGPCPPGERSRSGRGCPQSPSHPARPRTWSW